MIDWFSLAANSLWIIALSVGLATFGIARWEAQVNGQKLAERLSQPGKQSAMKVAGLLFCLGLAGTSEQLWQTIVWIVLALGFAGFLVEAAVRRRQV